MLYSRNETRDALGRVMEREEPLQGEVTSRSYRYDAAGRLVEEYLNDKLYAQYSYDPNGNRTQARSRGERPRRAHMRWGEFTVAAQPHSFKNHLVCKTLKSLNLESACRSP